jgi:multiple sugar transport system substrate-binding protein
MNMKKAISLLLTATMGLGMVACTAPKADVDKGFSPALDKSTSCHITIAGGYDNFEALETEFDRFNEYYPNVELAFTKVDDFNNMMSSLESKIEIENKYLQSLLAQKSYLLSNMFI